MTTIDLTALKAKLMGAYDTVADTIPHEGARATLQATRGSVEQIVGRGATTISQEGANAVAYYNERAYLGPPSVFLCNQPLPVSWQVVPVGGAIGAAFTFWKARQVIIPVATREAGSPTLQPTLVDKLKNWFHDYVSPSTIEFHSRQMLLVGVTAATAMFIVKFRVPPTLNDAARLNHRIHDPKNDSALDSTLRSIIKGTRAVVDNIMKIDGVPASVRRLAAATRVVPELMAAASAAALSYAGHSIVTLYASKVKTRITRNVVQACHVVSTSIDVSLGFWMLYAQSLPPPVKILLGVSFAHSVDRLMRDVGVVKGNATDVLRSVVQLSSLTKALAAVCISTYGGKTGYTIAPRVAALALLGPSLRAFQLPTGIPFSTPTARVATLGSVAAAHVLVDVALLATLRSLETASVMPAVSAFGRTYSIASVMSVIDLVAIAGAIGYQCAIRQFAAFEEQMVRVEVPPALFKAPSPTTAVPEATKEEWAREFDFASQPQLQGGAPPSQ